MPLRLSPSRGWVLLLRVLRQLTCAHPVMDPVPDSRLGGLVGGVRVVTRRCPRCHARRTSYEGRP